ncbi:hypothetical protein Aph02nite_47180 [Actinoplanes philippinensis]|uniref:hypothetical protein n=1 Tax=Actinoplanes philippinensis TaxID=35752 RepID=UPI0015A62106|nr:hypothetical protein [Actinoplanes philippinensis]GIE78768.1 hypothetical protein Aph02nite_47180 [Actinoplanes philippinensis]
MFIFVPYGRQSSLTVSDRARCVIPPGSPGEGSAAMAKDKKKDKKDKKSKKSKKK